MILRRIIFLILCGAALHASSQPAFERLGTLYKDNYVTVALEVRLNDPCTPGGRKSRFRYHITGDRRGYDFFLNWKMDYYNCNGSITCQVNSLNIGAFPNEGILESIDWAFDGNGIVTPYFDVAASKTRDRTPSFTKAMLQSQPPQSISGDAEIDYGDQTTLQVVGGTLGDRARWKWYVNSCGGQPVDSGASISVQPLADAKYFVRAEGASGTTDCASFWVKVNTLSREADAIDGRQVICLGEKDIPLVVRGGFLGKEAQWVWYEDNLNSPPLAKGSSIKVSPVRSTVYFVRAEAPGGKSNARRIDLKVISQKLSDPGTIQAVATTVCEGEDFSLSLRNHTEGSDAEWRWYKDAVNPSNLIGKGNSITINATASAIYYVRGEGTCMNTNEKSIAIAVNRLATNGSGIAVEERNGKSRKVRLSVTGGQLGDAAEWIWYRDQCSNGKRIGRGASITARVTKRTQFLVRAEGKCNTSECVGRSVEAQYKLRYTFFNFGLSSSAIGREDADASGSLQAVTEKPVVCFTFGHVKKAGWYLSGKYSLNNVDAAYTYDFNGVSNYSNTDRYYVLNGETSEKRTAITGGLVWKPFGKLYLMAGAGYGERELLWGMSEYSNASNNLITSDSWAKNTMHSYRGLELEGKIMLQLSMFNIMAGVSSLSPSTYGNYGRYYDYHGGIGFMF